MWFARVSANRGSCFRLRMGFLYRPERHCFEDFLRTSTVLRWQLPGSCTNQIQHWTRNLRCSLTDRRCIRRRQILQNHRSSMHWDRYNPSKFHIHMIRHPHRHRSHNCMHWDTCSLLLCCSLKEPQKWPQIEMVLVFSFHKNRCFGVRTNF